MKKQSILFKNLHAALDKLEILALEGEILDLDLMEGVLKKFEKINKFIKQKVKK